ncbi:MAG: ABC transporter permease [bacterium]|nr:ABC transporter permease [bacterium]
MWNEILGAVGLGLLWAVMTIGVYITYRILDVADLTVEGSITMGAAVCAVSITAGIDPYLGLLLAFFAGMAAGLCTGLLHTLLKIPPLLSGILTMIAAWSVNLRIMGKANVSLLKMPTVFTPVMEAFGMSKTVATIVVGAGVTLLFVCFCYWFFGTEVGCAIRATGGNPNMARAQGINTDRMKILGLVLSNGLVAVSGALIAQSQSFADIQMGTGSIVIGLASLIIGEVLFGKGGFFKRLISLALGAITYRLIIAAVLRFGMNANDLKLFTAITVALALSLPVLKAKLKGGRKGA